MIEKPDWWPENPYPEDIFPMTVDEYIAVIPDPKTRTAVSGHMARFGWLVAEKMIWERVLSALDDGDLMIVHQGEVNNGPPTTTP